LSSPTAKALEAGVKGHRSEAELKSIPPSWFQYRILNDKSRGLEALDAPVKAAGRRMTSGPASCACDRPLEVLPAAPVHVRVRQPLPQLPVQGGCHREQTHHL
jgi:hypothetical protein